MTKTNNNKLKMTVMHLNPVYPFQVNSLYDQKCDLHAIKHLFSELGLLILISKKLQACPVWSVTKTTIRKVRKRKETKLVMGLKT
jgi:hypothetical protein